MALNIKNAEVEMLAAQVAKLAGESKTEAIRKALVERHARLRRFDIEPVDARVARVHRWLEDEVWPNTPNGELGRRLTREEEDDILGYGPEGY